MKKSVIKVDSKYGPAYIDPKQVVALNLTVVGGDSRDGKGKKLTAILLSSGHTVLTDEFQYSLAKRLGWEEKLK